MICFQVLFFWPAASLVNAAEFVQDGQDVTDIDPSDKEDDAETETGEIGHFEMDEVVVTATRQADQIRNIPKNVTVITSDDIAQAPSNNVVDLLAREANLNLRSFFGSDKKAGIDIRGMGDTYVSNVIVMVDGMRLNSPDLSGADYATVPLNRIERIEVVRGAGSVLYGDGAVGGVINIITKKGEREPELMLYSSYGSYDTYDGRASFGGRVRDITFNVNADYYDSDGYRDNGYLRKKDGGIHLGYELSESVALSLAAAIHDDAYGLPGPVNKEDMDSRDKRTKTDRPDDFGQTTDERYSGGVEIDLDKWGIFNMQGSYRKRDNPYIMGFTPLLTKEEQTDTIDEKAYQLTPGYQVTYRVGGLEHRFQCGMDYFKTDYEREELSKNQIKNSKVETRDWFLNNEWHLPGDFILSAGYRKSRYEGRFRDDKYESQFIPNPDPPPPFLILPPAWVRGETTKEIWKARAFDVGLTCLLNRDTSLFASYSRSFRYPNVDELADADNDLHPQKGLHIDIGARHRVSGFMETSITLFQIKIEDEIYYGEDPSTGGWFNRNYDDKTIRRGVELDIKVYPLEDLFLWANYSYTRAKFDESGKFIPLVPRHKAGIGLEWQIMEPLLLSATGTLVGSRYDGNDQSNNLYEKLASYQVVDAKLSYEYKGVKVFAGVNNIFDDLYATSAYSEYYYTMPTCNAYAGVAWRY